MKTSDREALVRQYPALNNAYRLFLDAQLLRKEKRIKSSVALAILAIEEAGKFLLEHPMLSMDIDPPKYLKKVNSYPHKQKQRSAAEAVLSLFPIGQVEEVMDQLGFVLKLVPIGNDRPKRQSMADIISEKYNLENVRMSLKERITRIDALVWLLRGDLDTLKMKCLYVDDGDDFSWNISARFSDGILTLAGASINGVVIRLSMHHRCPGSTR